MAEICAYSVLGILLLYALCCLVDSLSAWQERNMEPVYVASISFVLLSASIVYGAFVCVLFPLVKIAPPEYIIGIVVCVLVLWTIVLLPLYGWRTYLPTRACGPSRR